ncbi:MAG: VOC family protein [Magnetospirillum sp.]|nr:VOC family protein [Magnetospirillum sp.]
MAGLDHINVVVSDPERSIAFYTHLLGLSVILDRTLDGPWFEELTGIAGARARCVILDVPGGGCRIELLKFLHADGTAIAANALPSTVGLRHFAVRVDNLEASLATLSEPPLIIAVPRDIVPVGKRMAYVRDPDGAIVELTEYGGTPTFC